MASRLPSVPKSSSEPRRFHAVRSISALHVGVCASDLAAVLRVEPTQIRAVPHIGLRRKGLGHSERFAVDHFQSIERYKISTAFII